MNKLISQTFKPVVLATLMSACSSVQAAPGNLVELNKELEIMSGVIDTALKQSSAREGIRYRSLEATYLVKQGVVFEVKTSGMSSGLSGWSDIVSMIPTAPLPPVAVVSGNGDYDLEFEFAQEWEDIAEDAVRQVEESFRETNEELRELRSRSRELSWEKRELERRKRDLEFEQRQAQGERKADIASDLKELNAEVAELAQREQELKQHADKIEQEQKVNLQQRKQAQEQAYKTFLVNFESSLGDALCRFGVGLRELPDNEHVSFVLKEFSLSEGHDRQDRVYVFSKQAIKSCGTEKMKVAQLLDSAEVYEF